MANPRLTVPNASPYVGNLRLLPTPRRAPHSFELIMFTVVV